MAGAIAIGGCANTGGGGGIPSIDPATIAQVQNTATQICGFLPTASTVASIIATFFGGGAVVGNIAQSAQAICDAVTKKGFRRGATIRVNGVIVRGSFVR